MHITLENKDDHKLLIKVKGIEFFTNHKLLGLKPEDGDQKVSLQFIVSADDLFAAFLQKLKNEEKEAEPTDEFVLQFGAAVGNAFAAAFLGEWRFSEKSGRWVVRLALPNGEEKEVNVFDVLLQKLKAEEGKGSFAELLQELATLAAEDTPKRRRKKRSTTSD